MTAPVVRGQANVNGATLAYEIAGNGPPIVLIHGFSFDMRSWEAQFAAFAARHTVLRYDLRGFGRSSLPGVEPYSHIDDLAALLQALGLGPAHLVGLSLGANVALAYALERPAAVRSLVLVSSGLMGHHWLEERPPDAAMAYAKDHGVADTKAFWLDHPLFASLAAYPEARASLAAIVAGYSGWHWQHHNPMRPFTVAAADLPKVCAPTLVVSGGRDVAGYREIADALAAGIPGAQMLTVPEAGHVLPMEVPGVFNGKAMEFIEAVETSTTSRKFGVGASARNPTWTASRICWERTFGANPLYGRRWRT
jgi:3-oxoadipate enol-lactonase